MSGGSYTSLDVIKRARAQIPVLEEELGRIGQARAQHKSDLAEVDQQLHAAWQYLATVLVPDLEPEHLNWGSGLLSLPAIGATMVRSQIEADRAALQHQIDELEGRVEYSGREAILNECSIHIDELDESLAPLQASVSAFESEPFFAVLLDVGYGTDQYLGKWWQLSYYQHWKHGDMIVASLGEQYGVGTFAELRAKYDEERAARDQLVASRDEWVRRAGRIEQVMAAHRDATQRLESLETRHLTRVRGLVIEHLRPLGPEETSALLASYPAGVVGFKRILGLTAKRHYLDETFEAWVTAPEAGIKKALRKAKRDVVKLARPKHFNRRHPQADVDRRFADRRPKWHERYDRYRHSRRSILDFDDYDTYDFADSRPWWSMMTADRYKARFIPEVAEYYERVPASSDADDVAALAMADTAGGDDWADMS